MKLLPAIPASLQGSTPHCAFLIQFPVNTVGKAQEDRQALGPLHPCGRFRRKLLALVWPSYGFCSHLGSGRVDEKGLSLSVYSSLCCNFAFQIEIKMSFWTIKWHCSSFMNHMVDKSGQERKHVTGCSCQGDNCFKPGGGERGFRKMPGDVLWGIGDRAGWQNWMVAV